MEEWGREEREEGDFAKVDNKDLQKKNTSLSFRLLTS